VDSAEIRTVGEKEKVSKEVGRKGEKESIKHLQNLRGDKGSGRRGDFILSYVRGRIGEPVHGGSSK